MSARLAAALGALFAPIAAAAAEVEVEAAWARASAGPARAGAVYVALVNRGAAAALVGVETPAAERAELHTHVMDGDMARMRRLEEVALPAGGRVAFAPGGLHVMLSGLAAPLVEGAEFPLTLRFADGDSRTVAVRVGGVAAHAPPPEHGAEERGAEARDPNAHMGERRSPGAR